LLAVGVPPMIRDDSPIRAIVDGDLAGDDGWSAAVANLEQIVTSGGIKVLVTSPEPYNPDPGLETSSHIA